MAEYGILGPPAESGDREGRSDERAPKDSRDPRDPKGWGATGDSAAPADTCAPDGGARRRPDARRRGLGPAVLAALAVGCLLVTGLAAVRVGDELSRPPTEAELTRATAVELARRWRDRPADQVFPGTLRYEPEIGGSESAARVGIDPGTRCADAMDAPLAESARRHGCVALARATYIDQLQGLLITVGIAVFPDQRSAGAFAGGLPKGDAPVPGLRAAAFSGSVAARFGDAARQAAASRGRGPYVVLATIGYADGRPVGKGAKQLDLEAVPPQLVGAVLDPLARPARPDCSSKDPAVRRMWSC